MAVEGSFICYADHMQAINSLKNVDSTALLQFLHPILNMLLHLIGSGGETLQVLQFILSGGFPLIVLSILFTRTWLHCLVPLFGRRIIECLWLLTMYYCFIYCAIHFLSGCSLQSYGQYLNQVCFLPTFNRAFCPYTVKKYFSHPVCKKNYINHSVKFTVSQPLIVNC